MNYLAPHALIPGVRFSLKNSAYEISFVDGQTIRYASCHGGKQHQIPISVFLNLVEEGEIGYLALGGSRQSASAGPESSVLTDYARAEMLRRFAYVKHALEGGRHPTSGKNLRRSIEKCHAKEVEFKARSGELARTPPGKSTLARWIKRYSNSGGSAMSLVPQTESRGSRSRKIRLEIDSVITRVMPDYLTDERLSGKQIHCHVVGTLLGEGIVKSAAEVPTVRTIYRRIAELDPYVVARKRNGKRFADAHFRAAGASFETARPMQMVMIDGHRMDVSKRSTNPSLARQFQSGHDAGFEVNA